MVNIIKTYCPSRIEEILDENDLNNVFKLFYNKTIKNIEILYMDYENQ